MFTSLSVMLVTYKVSRVGICNVSGTENGNLSGGRSCSPYFLLFFSVLCKCSWQYLTQNSSQKQQRDRDRERGNTRIGEGIDIVFKKKQPSPSRIVPHLSYEIVRTQKNRSISYGQFPFHTLAFGKDFTICTHFPTQFTSAFKWVSL